MQHNNTNSNAPLKLRFLLTSDCTARCCYCHNEGQAKDTTRLSLADITHVLDALAAGNRQVSEIILSGGEPTLHPELAEIARRCKATGALVSINTHGAHPGLLERALPWVDELKLHIDSFHPQRQKHSMGLSIDKVLQSIERSRQHPGLRTVVNHPLQSLEEACEVIATTRQLGVSRRISCERGFTWRRHGPLLPSCGSLPYRRAAGQHLHGDAADPAGPF